MEGCHAVTALSEDPSKPFGIIEGVEDVFVDAFALRYVNVQVNESGGNVYVALYPPKYNPKKLVDMVRLGYEPSPSWTPCEVTIRKRYSTFAEADHHLQRAVGSASDLLVTTDADELQRRGSKETRRENAKKSLPDDYTSSRGRGVRGASSSRGSSNSLGRGGGGGRGGSSQRSRQKRKTATVPDSSDEDLDEESDASLYRPISPVIYTEDEIEETPSLPTGEPPADPNSRSFRLQTEAANRFATTTTLITPPPANPTSSRIVDETNNSAAGDPSARPENVQPSFTRNFQQTVENVDENVNQQQVIRFQGGGSAHREPTFEPTSRRPTLVSSLNPRQNESQSEFLNRAIVTLAHNFDSRNQMDNQVVVGLRNLEQAVLQRPHLGATLNDFFGKPLLKGDPVVTDDASFESANEKLGDPQQFDLLRSRLLRVGGTDAGTVTRNLLVKMIHREFGKKLSWDGLKGNMRLSDKPVGRIILDVAINCASLRVTEQEAVQAIRNWLRHRKDKKKNAQNAPPPNAPV